MGARLQYSDVPITTNVGINFDYNFSQMFSKLDVAAFDSYAGYNDYYIWVMNHDFWRAIKPGKMHWLMETSCSHGGSIQNTTGPHPVDYLVAEAAVSYALDSQSFYYWLWKQQRAGCEITHSALMTAWNKPYIGYYEAEKVQRLKEAIEPLILATKLKQAKIALFYSDIARTFFEVVRLGEDNYTGTIRQLHKLIFELGFLRDVITETTPGI